MYTKNELMFPHYVIPTLQHLRSEDWRELVAKVLSVPESHEMSLAFVLTMIRLNGCLSCETDSYRAMRGCESCAIQTLRRHKGGDRDLLHLFNTALEEVRQYLTRAGAA